MKLRNQLLALFCLLIFVAFGVFYFNNWVVQKPFGIILFIGDGMTTGELAAARLYKGGLGTRLEMEQWPRLAFVLNGASDYAVPDAASAATALATGERVNEKSASTGPRGEELKSILALARQQGRSVGIVTNGQLANSGLAPFFAHTANTEDADAIAAQFVDTAKINIALGGGAKAFMPESKGGARKDGRDLTLELKERGEEVIRTKAELENASAVRTSSLIGFFAEEDMLFATQTEAAGEHISLADMVRRAILILQFNKKGYVLVVDAALISRAAEKNQGEQLLAEILELDEAMETARQYSGDKSLLIATGRHSIGGFSLNGRPLRQDHGVALIGKSAFGYPSITWASGPSERESEPSLIKQPVALTNASDMITLGLGPGSEEVTGFLDNTDIFKILKKNL